MNEFVPLFVDVNPDTLVDETNELFGKLFPIPGIVNIHIEGSVYYRLNLLT